jgi:hypothetical protein
VGGGDAAARRRRLAGRRPPPIAAAVNSSPPPAATTTVSDDQARTTAVVAVTDWLTYNPQTLSAYRNIAGARFGNGAAASAWSGSAWMAPDAVTAGTVVTQPDGDLVTQVTARVRIATPAQPTKTPTPPQSTSGDPGNDPTVPAGWLDRRQHPVAAPARPDHRGGASRPCRTRPGHRQPAPHHHRHPPPDQPTPLRRPAAQPWAVSLFTALAGTDATALGYLSLRTH